MNYRITLVGGDRRSISLASMLAYDGCKINVFGISKENISENESICVCKDITEALESSNIVVGPVPFCRNGEDKLNTPLYDCDIYTDDLYHNSEKIKVLIAGKIPENVKHILSAKGVSVVDILEREDFAVLNSLPTAEGTVQIAMEELPATIWNMKVLVSGAGRVGRTLALLLKSMGADVTVALRNGKDAAWAVLHGLRYCGYDFSNIGQFRLICNTVPDIVFDERALKNIGYNSLIIDLASDSGGVDYEYALSNNIKVIHALSLPGKVAPETAAENIKRVVYNVIAEDKKR